MDRSLIVIDQITAALLGVKPTNAEPDSELYACWRDRVELALAYDTDADRAKNQGDFEQAAIRAAQRDSMIRIASCYAI